MSKLLVVAMILCAGSGTLRASNSAASDRIMAFKILFHGTLDPTPPYKSDGNHSFHIRIYGKDGALIHDEVQSSDVLGGMYDVLLGSTAALSANLSEEYDIGVSVDGGAEIRTRGKLSSYTMICDAALSSTLDDMQNRIYRPLDHEAITAQMAERIAEQRGILPVQIYRVQQYLPLSPLSGFNFEMSVAPPGENTPTDAYQLAKYGRLNLEYNNAITISGNRLGLAAQAMHVAHHLLLYGAGLTSDINADGMLLMTAGWAHYQTGNSRDEPFVDAPFMRLKFKSSDETVFLYSELETTMHIRSYLSGMCGLGFRLTPAMQIIGGFHHTEFVMPTERTVREVEGIQGILSWGM